MKRNFCWFFLGLVAVACIAAALTTSNPIYLQNSDGSTVQIRVRSGAAQTAPWLEFVETNSTRFSLPATGIVPVAYGGTAGATAANARTNLGTALLWRQHLGLVEAQVTNTILPIANGGTGAETAAAAKTAFGIQSGTNIISGDSTVTQIFATAFTAAPYVNLTDFTLGDLTNSAIVSVSTTNFIAWGQTNNPFHWIAVGTP